VKDGQQEIQHAFHRRNFVQFHMIRLAVSENKQMTPL
jgi:hypothetical protein